MNCNPNASQKSFRHVLSAAIFVVVLGVGVRFALTSFGHNFDFESYTIVATVTAQGGNVYHETDRYNYGPAWFNVLHGLQVLADRTGNPHNFRYFIVGLLTLVDLAIAWLIARRFSLLLGAVFFLNPISMFITGYHNQFDNFALLIGLIGVLWYEKHAAKEHLRAFIIFTCLLGLSLILKHVLLFFPIWIALRERGALRRFLALAVPYGLFLLSFLPYVKGGAAGIQQNVFLYASAANAPLLNAFTFGHRVSNDVGVAIFIVALVGVGVLARRLPLPYAFALYGAALVAFSSSIVIQYFAIPMLFLILFPSIWSVSAITIATAVLLTHFDGLYLAGRLHSSNLALVARNGVYAYAVCLALALATAI